MQASFHLVNGSVQTLHSVLPECYLHHRSVAEVDLAIIFDWEKVFLTESDYTREGENKILLLCEGYSCHVRWNVLQLFKDNGGGGGVRSSCAHF